MFSFPYDDCLGSIVWDAMRTGKPYPIKSLIVHGANPALTFVDTGRVADAISKLDFMVVMDHFMSETAKMAHLVLPAATYMERVDICDFYPKMCNLPYVMMRKKTVQTGECWSDRKIWLELAKRMGYGEFFPWKDEEEVLDYILEPSGMTVQKLTEEIPEGMPYGEWTYGAYKNGLRTPSGKIELYSEILSKYNYDPLPVPAVSLSSGNLLKDYPLVLIHGTRQFEYLHSRGREVTKLKKMKPEALAEIHQDTAAKFGLKDGDFAVVETPRGSIEVRIKATHDIMADVVSIPHGWAEANVNVLTDYTPADPISGFPAKARPCKVTKA